MTEQTEKAPPRRPRSDALRNRQIVSDAAVDVFAERGLEATVAEVADRANVGNATVFRHFATKNDLVLEVATRWLAEWGDVLRARLVNARDDTLHELIAEVFIRLQQDRFALDILRAGDHNAYMSEARDEVEHLFTSSIARAQAAGLVAEHVTYADLSVLILGVCGRLSELDEPDQGVWVRMADYVWSAILRQN